MSDALTGTLIVYGIIWLSVAGIVVGANVDSFSHCHHGEKARRNAAWAILGPIPVIFVSIIWAIRTLLPERSKLPKAQVRDV